MVLLEVGGGCSGGVSNGTYLQQLYIIFMCLCGRVRYMVHAELDGDIAVLFESKII